MPSGGRREGAGRPAKTDKREQISISVSQETKEIVRRLREQGVKVGPLVDDLLSRYFEKSI